MLEKLVHVPAEFWPKSKVDIRILTIPHKEKITKNPITLHMTYWPPSLRPFSLGRMKYWMTYQTNMTTARPIKRSRASLIYIAAVPTRSCKVLELAAKATNGMKVELATSSWLIFFMFDDLLMNILRKFLIA